MFAQHYRGWGERDDIGCIQPPSIAFVARLDALLCILLDKELDPYVYVTVNLSER